MGFRCNIQIMIVVRFEYLMCYCEVSARDVDQDPVSSRGRIRIRVFQEVGYGSGFFKSRIRIWFSRGRIRIRFLQEVGSGSGFSRMSDRDPVLVKISEPNIFWFKKHILTKVRIWKVCPIFSWEWGPDPFFSESGSDRNRPGSEAQYYNLQDPA